MVIAVTTPTGHVGSRVVRLLLAAGERPRLLVRDADRLDAGVRDLVDVVEGDQADPAYVVAATRDVRALFWVDPPTDDPDPLASYARMTASVREAVRTNGVPRVVFQSSVGAEKRHGAGEIDGLAGTEVALDEVAAGVVHLRCGYFFTNLLIDPDAVRRGELATAMPVDAPMPWVDPRDIADVATAWLLREGWSGRHVRAVHGPEDLTFADVARILTEVLGREVTAVQVTDDDLRSGLLEAGMSEEQADALVGMSSGLREGFTPEQPRDVTTTTPTHLAGWAYDHLRPPLDDG